MVKRTRIDLNNLRLILTTEVPDRVVYTPWPELFQKIPAGQAAVLDESQANPDSVRAGLKRLHDMKQFTHLEVRVRGRRGERKTYVVNLNRGPRTRQSSQESEEK